MAGLVLYYGGEVGDLSFFLPDVSQPRLTHFFSQIQSLRASLDEQSGELSEMRNLLGILRYIFRIDYIKNQMRLISKNCWM